METPDYTVKVTNATDIPRITGTGISLRHVVTFYVGERGPFTLEYLPKDASAAVIQRDIATQVSKLRQLDTASY